MAKVWGKRSRAACVGESTYDLADAFSDFISASSRLEFSYRELQEEVNALRVELASQSAALTTSRADNDRMRRMLQQIVDSMPCGVLVVDEHGMISMINPESVRLLGLDRGNDGAGLPSTLEEISTKCGMNLEVLCVRRLGDDSAEELCVRGPLEDRWLEVRSRRLYKQQGNQGTTEQTILILRDITSQKRAGEERDAGRRAMALAEITTMLAHEIRNPLASLELFAGMIEKDPSRTRDWVSNLRAGIRSLSGTVNNVLSFHGPGSFSLVPLQLSHVVSSAVEFATPLAEQAKVTLRWSEGRGTYRIMGNLNGLKQVILNLIVNALRHTPAEGAITITVGAALSPGTTSCPSGGAARYVLEVSDTGCGIAEETMTQLFIPGFSGSNDRTGLGLAVCERIMRQHGGSIAASNNVLSGAKFTLEFPGTSEGQV